MFDKLIERIKTPVISSWQRGRNLIVIMGGVILLLSSINSINQMVTALREKELYDVETWISEMEYASHEVSSSGMPNSLRMANAQQNIPFILLDERMNVIISHLVDEEITQNPERLRRQIRRFTEENAPIEFRSVWSDDHYFLLYGTSQLLRRLSYIPYLQYVLFFLFFSIVFIALRGAKQGEQDRVWVGLAKETAHQLGTPISSLMGWVVYLREQRVEPEAIDEMERDLHHLQKVTDRFSKIGSDTQLTPHSVNEVVSGVVRYFRGRIPRGVTLIYDGLSMAPATANINATLFEWVIENLLKNSLDALQRGEGEIVVNLIADEQHVIIDVRDTGRGIPKGSWRKIFDPGFTTKKRGWGLGLSLSRRIIEEYHFGRIAVVASEINVGTTIRITLNRVFDL